MSKDSGECMQLCEECVRHKGWCGHGVEELRIDRRVALVERAQERRVACELADGGYEGDGYGALPVVAVRLAAAPACHVDHRSRRSQREDNALGKQERRPSQLEEVECASGVVAAQHAVDHGLLEHPRACGRG